MSGREPDILPLRGESPRPGRRTVGCRRERGPNLGHSGHSGARRPPGRRACTCGDPPAPAQVSAAGPRRPALQSGLPRPLLAALLCAGAARVWDLLLLLRCLALLFVRNETYWAVCALQFVCFRNV